MAGAAPKDLLFFGKRARPEAEFIAKKPRKFGPRECVTEAMLSAIGRDLPVKLAQWRLARLPVPAGHSPDVRFMSRVFLARGEEQLIHGVELAARFLDAREDELRRVFNLDDKKQERKFWTVGVVLDALEGAAEDRDEFESLRDGFARMLAFDCFAGAVDRHPENWGIIENVVRPARKRYAPLYDTARGLFGTHSEEKLIAIDERGDRAGAVARYALKSHPIFSPTGMPGEKLNHFDLLRQALIDFPDDLGPPVRQIIGAVDLAAIERNLRKSFSRIVTRRRLDFVTELLRFRYERLKFVFARTM